MKEIIFTTNHEPVLSFADKDFKTKYEERVGNNPDYIQVVNGDDHDEELRRPHAFLRSAYQQGPI